MNLRRNPETVELHELWAETPLAVLIDGPHHGKLVKVEGPYEVHMEDGIQYNVIPRGEDDWKFPIFYRCSDVSA